MFGLPDQAVGGIVAALIAGGVALLGLIISKEQEVSEFRQQWIDALREDIAAVIAHSHGIHGSSIAQRAPQQSLWDTVRDDATGIRQASARIRLRLNPNEKNKNEKAANEAVLEALKEYESSLAGILPEKRHPGRNYDGRPENEPKNIGGTEFDGKRRGKVVV